jgi:hypothetical protein
MNPKPDHPVRAWFSARAGSFGRMSAALCLGLPVLVLALARYLDGVHVSSAPGLYAVLALVGYYGLVLYLVLAVVFLLFAVWHRAALVATGAVLTLVLFYLLIDATVYGVYRFHIDAFWLQLALGSMSGIGISWMMWAQAVLALAASGALVWFLYRLAGRMRHRRPLAAGMLAAFVIAFAVSQTMHVVAYEQNDTRFTRISPQLPFYYPIHSHRNAARYAGLFPMITETAAPSVVEGDALGGDDGRSLAYPLRPVSCEPTDGARRRNILLILLESWRADTLDDEVSPRMSAFARRSSLFANHYSSGNSTPAGVFSLFYGIHSTYWPAVKANAASIDNPVLVDALEANGYAFGIFADSHFDRHKIKDAMFRGIEVHEEFEGRTPDLKDRDLTLKLGDFAEQSQREGRPFFGFAFYKSTHFNYYYPKDDARFLPAHKLNLAAAIGKRDRESVFNDYRNAVHYTDGLVGDLLDRLEAAGILQNTIVVITSDHGEEFDDNGANYWGHTGNFTGWQTRVPMVVYVPWREPRRVETVTAHIDIPPTLMAEALGCAGDPGAHSNGVNLFGEIPASRPVIVSSYVNHAVVAGENVFVVYPMYVQKHRLWDINAKADGADPAIARAAIEEMSRFYRTGALAHPQ